MSQCYSLGAEYYWSTGAVVVPHASCWSVISITTKWPEPDQLTAIAIDPTFWPGHSDKLLFDACWTMPNPNEIQKLCT